MDKTKPNNYQKLMANALNTIQKQKAQISTLQAKNEEKIAVIGMGCRFPGANDPQAFWQLLKNGECHITDVPSERWDAEQYFDADQDADGKVYTKAGGFLTDIDQFDNDFFGIVPREAQYMDPQHRLLLEVCWQALGNAGIPASKLKGSASGVYIGIMNQDNGQFSVENPASIDMYTAAGNGIGIASGRLSHALGLHGPSLSVDTNCSSSLTSIHMAAQGLLNGECNLALAGGVNMMLTPAMTMIMCKAKALSPSGVCSTFDEKADGYVRGEGAGIVVLKRLSDALENNDNIIGVIQASAINHDGRSSALPVPNGKAQVEVIQAALQKSALTPEQVCYVESHGTGTPLGDPIEIEAISKAYKRDTPSSKKLLVGSVKPNIGHLESAAGIASMIKVLLMFKHQQIPANVNLDTPNPKLELEKTSITLPKTLAAWDDDPVKYVGLSAFGFCGSNAHLIVSDEFNSSQQPATEPEQKGSVILALSAKSEVQLAARIEQFQDYITQGALDLHSVCFSANTSSEHWPMRACFMASSTADLLAQLTEFTPALNNRVAQGTAEPVISCTLTERDHHFLPVLHTWVLNNNKAKQMLSKASEYYRVQEQHTFAHWPEKIEWTDPLQCLLANSLLSGLWLSHVASLGVMLSEINAEAGDLPMLSLATQRLPFKASLDLMYVSARLSCGQIEQAQAQSAIVNCLQSSAGGKVLGVLPSIFKLANTELARQLMEHANATFEAGEGALKYRTMMLSSANEFGAWSIEVSDAQTLHHALVKALHSAYQSGADIDWQRYYQDSRHVRLDTPAYPMEPKHYPLPKVQPHLHSDVTLNNPDKFYQLQWQTRPTDTLVEPGAVGNILIFADQHGKLAPWTKWLSSQGYTYTLIFDKTIPTGYGDLSAQSYQVISDVAALDESLIHRNSAVTRIVFGWGLDLCGEQPTSDVLTRLTSLFGQLRDICTLKAGVSLAVITQFAASIAGTQYRYDPLQGAIAGLCKSIALEAPEVWQRQVDCDELSDSAALAGLSSALFAANNETQLAVRGCVSYAPRVSELNAPTLSHLRVAKDKAYVVTGGLGALGLSTAKWLAEQGAQHIILLGRSTEQQAIARDESGNIAAALQRLRTHVTVADYISVDVTNYTELESVLSDVSNRYGAIDGVFHTAGVNQVTAFESLSESEMLNVLAAKVQGAWHLHQLASQARYFVLFSSVASVWGSGGMAAYAAGNSFLDSLAYYRNALALPATSINWGPWADSGMAVAGDNAQLAEKVGLQLMSHNEALQAMGSVIENRMLNPVIANINISKFLDVMEFRRPLAIFEKLRAATKQTTSDDGKSDLIAALLQPTVSEDDKKQMLMELLRQFVSESLGTGIEKIQTDTPLMNLGLDSLTAFEVNTGIKKQLNRELPISEILKGASIQELAVLILEDMEHQSPDRQAHTADVEQLSLVEGEI
ncbi:SDR family NAD(P)-dependent oxidoreductase [Pseudoalteromonas sp. McH1-7]|uniref:type I polyketide synthase n=1 Tax=Pseudoalteromonas sp. McH1-7 TaxID=2745574 RepID=UPI00158FBADF|nr:SDR family NAD(P)-dependent oxidoreductase [Pseudoalteromonas sp. McH1-7]NUZ09760.1 SDR family NAD(P)-dependent oxidoreductase [Pseudoalteromonas sp. McH1-7]